jgi:MoaA/NifB/PqqE/SkfB family radical SAM enzyme
MEKRDKMNYNLIATPEINPLWSEQTNPLCKRAKLDTGTLCNLNCTFCYYKDRLDKMDNFKIIKDRIDYISSYSLIKEIELSGGESSIHPDWFRILKYCNEGFDHVSTLSHGQKFKDLDFLLKSKDYGLKEILFSMHGTDHYHDEIVGKPGAYKNLVKAITNSLSNGIITRINCTITTSNRNCIDNSFLQVIYHFIKFGLKQVNFIFHNYWDDNAKSNIIKYEELSVPVLNTIRQLKVSYPEFDIRIRYLPFCFAGEFTDLVYGQFQHVFDTTDWNKEVYNGDYKFDNNKQYTWSESLELGWNAAKRSREYTYYKPKECMKCKWFKECDGIEKQLKGKQDVYPQIEHIDFNS